MLVSREFRLLDNVEMPMRDGILLRADIWLPEGDGPWPVLLQRTPYQKEDAFGTQYISGMEFKAALRRGYAIVIQDTRGRYGSDGDFDPFVHEGADGADTLDWLLQQNFCNGQVVMFGASYVGATQVLLAARDPDGLVAISPHLTTARHGETWTYRSGATELGFLLLWIIESLGPEDLRRRLPGLPPDAAEQAQRVLAQMLENPQKAYERLPILDDSIVALAPYARRWFDSKSAEAAANDQEALDRLAVSRLPMLVSCGWNDLFVEGSIELFETARQRWHNAESVPDRLIIGPWSHGNPSDWQGDFWLGYAASTAGLCEEQLSFFDDARAGRLPETPMVRYFRSGSNTWHAAPDWPLPGTVEKTLFLSESGLSDDPTSERWQRVYQSDPNRPVPTVGGANFLPGLLQARNSGPKDQFAVESRSDVLIFTSPPLEQDLEVTGLVEANLWVSSSARSTDWNARLCAVDWTGRSVGLVDGVARSVHADGELTAIQIRVGHVSHLFKSGDSIRLQISSSNFPRFDRNPQTGFCPTTAGPGELVVATNVLHGGEQASSCLRLRIIPNAFPVCAGLRRQADRDSSMPL